MRVLVDILAGQILFARASEIDLVKNFLVRQPIVDVRDDERNDTEESRQRVIERPHHCSEPFTRIEPRTCTFQEWHGLRRRLLFSGGICEIGLTRTLP